MRWYLVEKVRLKESLKSCCFNLREIKCTPKLCGWTWGRRKQESDDKGETDRQC